MKSFKDKLLNYEENPPQSIWENVNTELHNDRIVSMKTSPRLGFKFYTAAAAAVILLVLAIGRFVNLQNDAEVFSTQQTSIREVADSFSNNQTLKKIIEHDQLAQQNPDKRYLTIAGPNGEPVQISSKAATLILWADNEYPPKAIWKDTIGKWQQMMLTNTDSPTSAAGLLEIIQQSLETE